MLVVKMLMSYQMIFGVLLKEKHHTDRTLYIYSYFLLCCTLLPSYVTGERGEHEMEASGETSDQTDPPQVKRMNVFIYFVLIYLFLLTVRFVFLENAPQRL